jgi:hypothetical protein
VRRSAYVLALVAPLAVLLGLYVSDAENRRGTVGRSERPPAATRPADDRPASRRDVVDLAAAKSRDLFKEDPVRVVVAGRPVVYQRNLFAAKSAEGDGSGAVVVEELTWLANAEPKNRAAVERLVVVDPNEGGARAVEATRAAFGRTTGVRAARATAFGGVRLAELSRLELRGAVHAVFVDPETPGDRIDVETESLDVLFVDGRPTTARADGAVRVYRPARRDAEFAGLGLVVAFAGSGLRELTVGELLVEREIDATLFDPAAAGLPAGPPLRFRAAGPLRWTPHAAGVPGRIDLGGALDGERGFRAGDADNFRFRAAGGRVLFAADGGRLDSFAAEGGVHAEDPLFTVDSDRMELGLRKDRRRATFRGAASRPTTAVLRGLHLPGGVVGDTTLTCAGLLTAEPSVDAFQGATDVVRLHASTKVTVEAATGRLTAGDATAFAGRVAGKLTPLRLRLAQGVAGSTDEIDLKADALDFDRDYDADGTPRTETLVLRKNYEVVYRDRAFLARPADFASRPVSRPATGAATRPDLRAAFGLLRTADVLAVAGADRFEATRSALDAGPSIVSTVGVAVFRLEERGAKEPAAKLSAGRVTIVVDPPALSPDGRRRVTSCGAEDGVTIELPGIATAVGRVLRLRLAEEEVELAGGLSRAKATVRGRTGVPDDAPETFEAHRFNWNAALRRLVASAAPGAVATAEVRLRPLPWIDDDGAAPSSAERDAPVATTLEAGEVTVDFVDDAVEGAPRGVRRADAKGGVSARQPDRRLRATTAVFDVEARTGVIAGEPLVYRAVRREGATAIEDRVEAPRASVVDGAFVVDGPLKARVHFAPARSAFAFGVRETPADASSTPEPVDLVARGGATFGPAVCELLGGVSARQGDPAAGGFEASGDRATFFLAENAAEEDLVLAVLRGDAVFRAPRLEAAADVMKFDRVASRLKLYNERPAPVRFRAAGAGFGDATAGVSALVADFVGGRVAVTAYDFHALMNETDPRPGAPR